jgi:hypothetical protein
LDGEWFVKDTIHADWLKVIEKALGLLWVRTERFKLLEVLTNYWQPVPRGKGTR